MASAPDVNPAGEKSRFCYQEAPLKGAEHREDRLTRVIERQAARVPSGYFLTLALAVMSLGVGLEYFERRRASRFIDMWPGPLLVMGVYIKLVKVLGPR